MNQRTDYLAYLLRLWRDGEDKPWRATLQNPHTGERRHFSTLAALLSFLEEQTGQIWVVDMDEVPANESGSGSLST